MSGKDGSPGFARVVDELHAINPNLPVLSYLWATVRYKGARSANIATQGLSHMPQMLLKSPITGQPVLSAAMSYGNVTSPAYQQMVISRIKQTLSTEGTDGVVSDVSERQPFTSWCAPKPQFCKDYASGVDTLFGQIRTAIAPKPVLFNGLWGNEPGRIERQEKLLNDTDGALIEWFGRIANAPIQSFKQGLLPYMQAIQRHPDKQFLVFARGSSAGYTGYVDDYLWQRYLYAAYLMVARSNTSFRYLSTFQSVSTGRAYMFTLYDDVATKIGVPSGPYQLNGDLYSRKFSKGLALFVPTGGKPETYALPGTLYSADGQSHTGKVQVAPGEGLVLLDYRPPAHPFSVAFSNAAASNLELPASGVVTPPAGGAAYLAMQALPAARLGQHDILLSPIKTMHPSLGLHIRLRTKDPSASLQVVAEVDDAASKAVQAITALDAGACPAKAAPTEHIAFRWPRSPLEFPQGCASHFLMADGQWHTYTIPVTGILPSNLTVRRWGYVRFNGVIELQSIVQAAST